MSGIRALPSPSSTTSADAMISPPRDRVDTRSIVIAGGLVALLGLLAYFNSFKGEFVFDDIVEILENPNMDHLLPPWRAALGGVALPARPLPYYSFAIDTAIWRRNPLGYHFLNVGLHLGTALLLFGIARRTFLSPKLVERFGSRSVGLAFLIAALWVVHPLHTQAVTYIYQRMESMMAFFFATSLYCFIRSQDSEKPVRWLSDSVICALLAMLSKESGVVILPTIFLYDVVFRTDSWRATLRARHLYYLALFAAYVPLATMLVLQRSAYLEFREPKSALTYALNQPAVIIEYLRLFFIPVGQSIDHDRRPVTDLTRLLVPLAAVVGAVLIGLVGIARRRPWGWLMAVFFLTLLPTSSVIPVADLINEHRMYLPSAAVAALVVVGIFMLYDRLRGTVTRANVVSSPPGIAVAVAIAVLICATHMRNRVYYDRIDIWKDAFEKQPRNIRAFENLMTAYARHAGPDIDLPQRTDLRDRSGDAAEIERFKNLISQNPQAPTTYNNLALTVRRTDPKRAEELFAKALALDPNNLVALSHSADLKAADSEYHAAAKLLRRAIEQAPDDLQLQERLRAIEAATAAGR